MNLFDTTAVPSSSSVYGDLLQALAFHLALSEPEELIGHGVLRIGSTDLKFHYDAAVEAERFCLRLDLGYIDAAALPVLCRRLLHGNCMQGIAAGVVFGLVSDTEGHFCIV